MVDHSSHLFTTLHSIELVIIDDRTVVYKFPIGNSKTEVTATSRRVAERMLIVGGCQKRAATWFLPSHSGSLFMYSWIGSKTGTASDLIYSSMSCLGDFFSPIPNFLAQRTMELKASAVSTFQFFSSGLMQKNSVFPFKTFLRKR